jgi:hypothetical protein
VLFGRKFKKEKRFWKNKKFTKYHQRNTHRLLAGPIFRQLSLPTSSPFLKSEEGEERKVLTL